MTPLGKSEGNNVDQGAEKCWLGLLDCFHMCENQEIWIGHHCLNGPESGQNARSWALEPRKEANWTGRPHFGATFPLNASRGLALHSTSLGAEAGSSNVQAGESEWLG